MAERELQTLMRILGYDFKDEGLLREAITHSSWSNEHPDDPCNERLEFIGDAVLGFVIAGILYERFPGWDEGMLTAAKSHIVGRDHLHDVAVKMGLHDFLILGEGERRGGVPLPASLGVDGFEAVMGAIFLDGGIEAARRVIGRFMTEEIEAMGARGVPVDPKSRLQTLSLHRFGKLPVYHMQEQIGPDHEKEYVFSAATPDGTSATGKGPSKKEAQKNAAANLIKLLE
jgi:ribonuclease-3